MKNVIAKWKTNCIVKSKDVKVVNIKEKDFQEVDGKEKDVKEVKLMKLVNKHNMKSCKNMAESPSKESYVEDIVQF